MPKPPVQTLGVGDLIERLAVAKRELEGMAPAPRVELDRDAVLSLVTLCHEALTELTKVH